MNLCTDHIITIKNHKLDENSSERDKNEVQDCDGSSAAINIQDDGEDFSAQFHIQNKDFLKSSMIELPS